MSLEDPHIITRAISSVRAAVADARATLEASE
jgi:hypothetical protein